MKPWTATADLSDEDLFRLRAANADRCVKVVQMSDEDQNRVAPKGGASPREAGAFNALIAFMMDREIQRRGLETPEQAL